MPPHRPLHQQEPRLVKMIKDLGKLPTIRKLFGQKLPALNPALMASEACFLQKREACVPMPVFKYFAAVGSALLVLLFVSDALFGVSESNSRFDGSLYESA